MNDKDYGSADFKKYLLQCASRHTAWPSIGLENTDGEELVSFDAGRGGGRSVLVTGAEVAVDADSPTGRKLTVTVLDRDKELLVSQGSNYINRMLHAKVGVPVPSIPATVWRTLFQGPIVSAPRSGDVVTFTAHGKARYGLHGIKEITVYPKGMAITTVIKTILHDLCGEPYNTMGNIPDLPAKLSEALILHIQAQPWIQAQQLAAGLTRHLHYAGDGSDGMIPAMPRTDSTRVAYTFTSAFDQPGLVSSAPQVSTDILGTIKDAVRVIGGATKTQKAPFGYAFATGDFSPARLGRNDSEAYYWDLLTIKTLHSQAAVDRVAAQHLARDLVGDIDARWDSMPLYVLDEYDLLEIDTNELHAFSHWRNGTIPLDIDGAPTQTFGFNGRRVHRPFAGRQ